MTIKEKVLDLGLPTSKTIDVFLLLSEVASKAAGIALVRPDLFTGGGGLNAPASVLSIMEMPHTIPPVPKSLNEIEVFEQLFNIKLQHNG